MADNENTRRFSIAEHRKAYLETGGEVGHFLDLSAGGGSERTPTLLLRVYGRKSGEKLIAPVIYGEWNGGYVVIASHGGTDVDPNWFLNLAARPDVAFQVGAQVFEGAWRVLESEERQRVWSFMVELFAPYAEYQTRTDRIFPVVLLTPERPIAAL